MIVKWFHPVNMFWGFALTILATSCLASDSLENNNSIGHNRKIEIAKYGKACTKIILPVSASECEKFSAQELQKYIKIMCGVSIPIFSEKEAENGILIGKTAQGVTRAEKCGLGSEDEEAFLIEAGSKDNIFLLGNSDRSTLYSAYTFLEKLGCLWLAPGMDHVPQKSIVEISKLKDIEKPGFKYRCLRFIKIPCSNNWEKLCLDWAVKQKINVYMPSRNSRTPYSMDSESFLAPFPEYVNKRGGFRSLNIPHNSGFVLNKKITKIHPSWLAQVRGSRIYTGRHWWPQPCTSNQEVIDYFSLQAEKYFKAHPSIDMYPVTQSDGTAFCECKKCKAMDTGREWDRGLPSITERWITFVNKIWENTRKKYPDKKLYFVAYHQTVQPPDQKTMKPSSGVMVELVHSNPNFICVFHKLTDKECPKNVKFMKILDEWTKISKGGVYVYDYCPHSLFRQLPYIAYKKFFHDIRKLKKRGVIGYEAQSDTKIMGAYIIDYYAVAKAMWNPHLNPDEVMTPFFKGMFGGAAEYVKSYCDFLEKKLDSSQHHGVDIKMYLSAETINEAGKYLDMASKAAKNPRAKLMVEILKEHQFYAAKLREALNAYSEYKQSGKQKDLKKAVASLRNIHALYLKLKKNQNKLKYSICWGRVDHGSDGKGIMTYLKPWEYALKNAKLTIPAKSGIKIGVYFAGIASEQLISVLMKVKGFNPFSIPDLKKDTLEKCQVVIVPSSANKSQYFNIESKFLRKWVENGGAVILLHDAVGYRKHHCVFPEIGKGKTHLKHKNVKASISHPISNKIKLNSPFPHDYYDHIIISPGNAGKVILTDAVDGSPALVAGNLGKGKVVLNGMITGMGCNQVGIRNIEMEPSGKELDILINSVKWLGKKNEVSKRTKPLAILTGEKFQRKTGKYLRRNKCIFEFASKELKTKPDWVSMDIFSQKNKQQRDTYKRIFIPRGIAFSPALIEGITDYVKNGGLLITNFALCLIDTNGDYRWDRKTDKLFLRKDGGFELVGAYGHSNTKVNKIKIVKLCPLTEGLGVNKWINLETNLSGSKTANYSAVPVVVSKQCNIKGKAGKASQPCVIYKRTGKGACIYINPVMGVNTLKNTTIENITHNILSDKTLNWLTISE